MSRSTIEARQEKRLVCRIGRLRMCLWLTRTIFHLAPETRWTRVRRHQERLRSFVIDILIQNWDRLWRTIWRRSKLALIALEGSRTQEDQRQGLAQMKIGNTGLAQAALPSSCRQLFKACLARSRLEFKILTLCSWRHRCLMLVEQMRTRHPERRWLKSSYLFSAPRKAIWDCWHSTSLKHLAGLG